MNTKHLLLALVLAMPGLLARAVDTNVAVASADGMASFSGKVVETTNTAGYTYVLVDTGGKKLWAATTQFAVSVGDTATVAGGMPMANYHSQSLNRDFDVVYFTGSIAVQGGAPAAGENMALPPGHPPLPGDANTPALPAGHPAIGSSAAATPALPPGHPALGGATNAPSAAITGLSRAAGGKTVAEVFAAQSKLAGHPVAVRGKVVKYNAMILGKNWLHLQDGSGTAAKMNNDLTVTTANEAKLGDTVLVTGNVSTNKDFGAGYKYAVLLEDAKVTVE